MSKSLKLLRAKELPWERQTSWTEITELPDHALEFQLQEGACTLSLPRVATQNRSYWHCSLLPAHTKPVPLPQAWA